MFFGKPCPYQASFLRPNNYCYSVNQMAIDTIKQLRTMSF